MTCERTIRYPQKDKTKTCQKNSGGGKGKNTVARLQNL